LGALALSTEVKNGGLGQYGAGPFEQQQFGTAGVEVDNKTQTKNTNLNKHSVAEL